MKRHLIISIFIVTLFFINGCSTHQNIWVKSDPPGAEIWLNGLATGQRTPAKMEFNVHEDYTFRLIKENYRPASAELHFRHKSAGDVGGETAGAACLSVCCLGIPIVIQAFNLLSYDYYWEANPGEINLLLSPNPYQLTITTDQPDCEVFINGNLRGTTVAKAGKERSELVIQMTEAGEVSISIVKTGYTTVDRKVKLTPDSNLTLHFSQAKEPADTDK